MIVSDFQGVQPFAENSVQETAGSLLFHAFFV